MDKLQAAVLQLTSDVSWLVRLGKWGVSLTGALVLSILPFTCALHNTVDANIRRIDTLESTAAALISGQKHIVDRAVEDHRNCHGARDLK